MPKVILVSQFPLPYSNIGSWTTMYSNYLQSDHQIDYVVCEKPISKFENVTYSIVQDGIMSKLKKRFYKNKYAPYLDKIKQLVLSHQDSFIIQVVDNFGLIPELHKMLIEINKRKQSYIQFFYHGFSPFFGNFQGRDFFSKIDEMVLLTHDSYETHKSYYTILPCVFNVLYNGIDANLFKQITENEKKILRKSLNIKEQIVFMWCANDRPKKGLDLILKTWKLVQLNHKNCALIIVGSDETINQAGVYSFGKVPNKNVVKFYQASDCYVFPTLCHEGFGLTLIEALHCGCYVMASALGGVPEVLGYGKFGLLIEKPHFINYWVEAIENFISNKNIPKEKLPTNIYTDESWKNNMNAIINKAKRLLE